MTDPELDPALFISHVDAGLTQLEYLLNEDLGLDVWAWTHTRLEDLNRRLAELRSDVATKLGTAMGEYRVTVEGVGTLERHHNKSRRNWDSDNLLRLVLDSDRRPKNGTTGEVESDLDVLKDVYGLRGYNARLGALKDRGIDADEFCEYESRGWKIAIKGAKK